ncbi:MAG TPA: Txe/YoeB family addiction module toxin [Segetibacter sp.]|jgi:toxin YoeB
MRKITFTDDSFREYNNWIKEDFEVVQKIQLLLRDIQQNPFKGLGKPEPLKGDYSGIWSRRITHKDKLIYKVSNENIEVVKCSGHY